MPLFIWLDGEYWWQHRPDLWNWWDPTKPGYDPRNKENVEWFSWNSDDALKISWLNWGRQIRMLPPPNLMSPRYRAACHEKMRLLVPIILDWWKALPADQRHLLAGVKVGWESSIGVNNFYYPNGNDLLDKPADEDPRHGIKATEVPARGLVQLGYAAVKTAGIRTEGQITEADLAEVARRHMEDLARLASELGVPRDRLYTHGAGWKEKELLYGAAVNPFSCPGWSFYRHAGDPSKDAGVQEALARSDAPHWGAVEWLYQGPRTVDAWRDALEKTLADPRCRLICIVNWSSIKDDAAAHEALAALNAADAPVEKPNIIVILADDLGYGDVQCYNPQCGKIPTPSIDTLASQGMRFTDGHSSSGVCSPSRYALLTGRYHWRTRLQNGIVGVFARLQGRRPGGRTSRAVHRALARHRQACQRVPPTCSSSRLAPDRRRHPGDETA
ncbi:MAG TPA: sulfatase-like hydrolase/transferase [Candidatus Paceibacterota bacterium]|nr:sulfatase-like hydrolase/transferase [Candidatus Paceibacterota bacterium]HRZ58318.1 sulfatase-like hydrolase/transferase [Candidatus Paceibacterota bacterium]